MQGIEEGSGQFVVACCDGPVDLELSNHSLDAVALAIDALVPADLRFDVGFPPKDILESKKEAWVNQLVNRT